MNGKNYLVAILLFTFMIVMNELVMVKIHDRWLEGARDQPLVPGTKSFMWQKLKLNQKQVLDSHQYCMLWCPADEFSRISEWNLYRDISPIEARKRGSYYSTESREFYQSTSQKALEMVCCQVATRESFTFLLDSRRNAEIDRDVTLVTYGTFERIEALREIRKRWHGPIVAVMYFSDHNDVIYSKRNDGKHMSSVAEMSELRRELQDPIWDNTAVVVYYGKFTKDQQVLRIGYNANYFTLSNYSHYSASKLYSLEEAGQLDLALLVDFPINTLRNVAQDFALTRFVFAVDIDFLPDNSMYEFFREQATKTLAPLDKAGIVVPHFDRRRNCEYYTKTYEYPLDFPALDEQMKDAVIRPFACELSWWNQHFPEFFHWSERDMKKSNCSASVRPTFAPGVFITDYIQWFKNSRDKASPETFELPQEVVHSTTDLHGYEPYLLLDRIANGTHTLMRYNEVFINRHRDKASWIFGLRLTGYRFFTGKDHFLIHKNHPFSPWIEDTKGGVTGNKAPADFLRSRMFLAADTYIETLSSPKIIEQLNAAK